MHHQGARRKQLIVVVGPTAVGKTKVSIQLAQSLGTEIICADSRQCYRKMSIGTAKPTSLEQAQVPHHLVNFLPLDTPYSAGAFEKDALACLDKLWHQYDQVIVAGGSGLYVRALCEGLAPMPKVSREIYRRLEDIYEREGLASLLEELRERDAVYYAQVEQKNPHRVIRALAVCQVSGKPYSYFRRQSTPPRSFDVIKVGLMMSREALYARINQRVDVMVEEGLFEEAEGLYPYRGCEVVRRTIAYPELFGALEGRYSREEAVELIKQHTRQFAKRQLVWFKADKAITWFSPSDLAGIQAYVKGAYVESDC